MGLKRYGGPPAAVARADAAGTDLPAACLGCSGCANPHPQGIAPAADVRMARVVSQPLAVSPVVEAAIADAVRRSLAR
jgi:hypothetical protein